MVTLAAACLEGSATLCAITATAAGDGKICGEVKLPLLSTLPHALGHDAPVTLQRNAVFGWPALLTLLLNGCSAPNSTAATFGAICTAMSLTMATLALPDFVGSAALMAVMVTLAGDGRLAGAVYAPAEVIVPAAAPPPGTPFTLQVTAVFVELVTVATNVCVFPSVTPLLCGATLT